MEPKKSQEEDQHWRDTVEFLKPRIRKFMQSLNRIAHLVRLTKNPAVSPAASAEILRSVVVFTHAILEDFLRTIGRLEVAENPTKEFLQKVPLATKATGRPEKFTLPDLLEHKDKSVFDLISESVEEHIKRKSFSDTDEIAAFLMSIKIDVKAVNKTFGELSAMIKRRHQIVHQADYPHGSDRPEEIADATVLIWLNTTRTFCLSALNQLIATNPGYWQIDPNK